MPKSAPVPVRLGPSQSEAVRRHAKRFGITDATFLRWASDALVQYLGGRCGPVCFPALYSKSGETLGPVGLLEEELSIEELASASSGVRQGNRPAVLEIHQAKAGNLRREDSAMMPLEPNPPIIGTTKSTPIPVRMEPDQADAIRRVSRSFGITDASFFRWACDELLEYIDLHCGILHLPLDYTKYWEVSKHSSDLPSTESYVALGDALLRGRSSKSNEDHENPGPLIEDASPVIAARTPPDPSLLQINLASGTKRES